MERPDTYIPKQELKKDLMLSDSSFSAEEEIKYSNIGLSGKDIVLLKAASKNNENIFNAYIDILTNGSKAVNKTYSGGEGSPYFLSSQEYLNITRPVNGVLARFGFLKKDFVYPQQINSHVRTAAQIQTDVITGSLIHGAPLAYDLLNKIHPIMLKQAESFVNLIKSLSYISLPSYHFGSYQQIIQLLSGSKDFYVKILSDCFKGLHKLISEYAEFHNFTKNRIQHFSISSIEGSYRPSSVNLIKSINKTYLDDIQFFESLLVQAFDNYNFSQSFKEQIKNYIESTSLNPLKSPNFYNNPLNRVSEILLEDIKVVINTTFDLATKDLLYFGSGWFDSAFGEIYKKGMSNTLTDDGIEVTRAEQIKKDKKNFVASQPPNNSPRIVVPPVFGEMDINLNPFFVKKSPKRTFVEDYKERIPTEEDHLLSGGDGDTEAIHN